jgi:hypothetical protein
MSLPNFIIAGAPKCGTTALWSYLNEHPEVCMARIKEPHFFSKLNGQLEQGLKNFGPIRSGRFRKGFKWYESLFNHKRDAKALGEASTHYFSAIDSANLIKETLPKVRLIIILRDPVKRLYSHYWQEYKLGLNFPDFDMMVRNNHPRFQWYCFISSYSVHLERFYSTFSEDQIMVLLLDDLIKNPIQMFCKVCHFIGVDSTYIPSNLGKKFNQQTLPKLRSIEKFFATAQESYIADKIPDRFRSYIGILRRTLSRINSVPHQYPMMPHFIKGELANRFEQDVEFVENLIGRNLNDWKMA